MEEFTNQILSTPVLALIIAIIIFVITVYLLIRRLIGFFITMLLLFFAIVSGYAILNHDIVRNWLKKQTGHEEITSTPKEEEKSFKEMMIKAYEELKEKVDQFIHKSESPESQKK